MEVGSAVAGPGQRGTGFLKVLELNDGSTVNMPIIIMNGLKKGPTLWIECCMHGNEVASTYALFRTLRETDPAKLTGTLIAVPVVNITGFNMNMGSTAIDPRNLNRTMPGDPKGSFAERYASVIYETIKAKADYVVDAHGVYSSGGVDSVDFVLYNGEVDVADKSRELAKSSALEFVVADGAGGVLKQALFNVIAEEGIPSICTESNRIEELHQAFNNFLKHLGMIEGKPVPARSQTLCRGYLWRDIVIKRGGLFHPKVQEKDKVSEGQVLGVVTNLFGEEVEKVISPVDGLVLVSSTGYRAVKPGDYPFRITIPE